MDIGDRIDVVPIDQGFEIDKGTSKIRFGGANVTESLGRTMSELGHRYVMCNDLKYLILEQIFFDGGRVHPTICEGEAGIQWVDVMVVCNNIRSCAVVRDIAGTGEPGIC